MDMEDELSRQYGQLNLSDPMSNLGIVDPLPLEDDEGMKPDNACNLIVNYLPHDVDDLALRALFQEFGEIIMTKVVRDKNTKKSMGYGFVKFVEESDAMNAIEKMNGYAIGHKNLKVSVARPPSLEIRNCKLYVTNLPKDYSEREVIALFKEFGEIIECRVLKDRNSKVNKGVAFVQFNVKAQANNALSLNGCQLEGSSRPLVVKYAEDQHKKKELSRLHNLTINNAFRGMGGMGPGMGMVGGGMPSPGMPGGMSGMNGMSGMPTMGGGMPGSNGMPSPKPQRLDNKDMLNTAYFYQQQSLPSMYAPQSSPMSVLPNPMNQSVHSPTSGNGWFNTLQPSQMQYMQNPGLQLSSQLASQSVDLGFNQSHLHTLSVPLGGHSMGGPMANNRPMGGGARPPPLGMGMMGGEMDMNGPRNMLGMGYPLMPPSPHGLPPSPHGMSPHGMPPSPHSTGSMGASVVISNLPSMADVTMLHELCAPYGRILSANLEDSRRGPNSNGNGSNSTSPGSIRGRVFMETVNQAEMVAQSLHGAVLFEGCPPLQVQISLNGSMPQHRL